MSKRYEWSLLILRVVLGLSFFVHGLVKFQSGLSNIAGWFSSIGLPGFLAYVVAIVELAGGIAMILGIGTRVVAFLFAFIMIGAIFTVKISAGFLGNEQMAGYELDLAFLAMSVALLISGSRLYALDQLFQSRNDQV
ncbi:DoxX family protein [Caldalkalibacillus thermarum TA2.A1]|uniref:DoxX family protein n=1 Tax=Caldalkalibacillus thermarum (strain TA2.A1) TaxID=986075 RepID=F5L380_CALTT|nr:DoxX family protein [Caldalkalibacillus thermarum]EGL84197.1 DoxX family protein [Caldalkalibacillus thermarum TA2.A1]QZT32482.1 DoxX family protein [Caldalkalibacillus thermarum TA2.A1]